jgi:hypothetical protein
MLDSGRLCNVPLMGGRGEESCIQGLDRETLEDQGVDGRIILKWVLENWDGGGGGCMDWICLAQDRDKW